MFSFEDMIYFILTLYRVCIQFIDQSCSVVYVGTSSIGNSRVNKRNKSYIEVQHNVLLLPYNRELNDRMLLFRYYTFMFIRMYYRKKSYRYQQIYHIRI